jgi:subtilase family serine protease
VSDKGRATPDLSADADPETGYLLWYTFGDSADPNAAPSFEQFGGTSFVAPQLNGVASVIDSALGHRVGFWNPSIYKFALQGNSPFTPLDQSGTTNDNLLYTGTPGAIYNVGSGLGTPDFATLAQDFASKH